MASSNKKTVASANKSKTGFRIAGYIRVSTEEQAENPEGSIKNQEERLHMTVKLKNMEGHFGEIVHVYVDRAKSGKDTNRPELQKLLLAIRRHEIDLVMVSELSRISRSIKDFSQIWELMQQNNCGFYSLRENFDTTTAAGEMVLFTVANIAQFERRQISERVVANFNVRAQRGLFNGGSIPLGYMRIPDKKGYLDIDEESAKLVRAAFKFFIQEGSLSSGARKLNEMGYRIKSDREGGGDKVRLGIFTSQNLYNILTNQSYIGVKVYTDKGTKKQAPAVWPAIIDKDTFTKANEILIKNYQKDKSGMENRYPYILSGLIKCKSCGDSMVGKSAHGKQEKYGYYEHAWSTKKNTTSPGSKRRCEPYRVLAKELEPMVWEKIIGLLTSDKIAHELLYEARKCQAANPHAREIEKAKAMLFSADQQLELLAERLATLPMAVSASPIYKQMEKLQGVKREAEAKFTSLQQGDLRADQPAELGEYKIFLDSLREWLKKADDPKVKTKIIRRLIKRIVVGAEVIDVHFYVGETYIRLANIGQKTAIIGKKNGLKSLMAGPQDSAHASDPECESESSEGENKKPEVDFAASGLKSVICSNTVEIGVPNKTTTSKLIPQSFIPLTVLEKSKIGEKVVELFGAGHSLTEIAEQVKKSRKSIQGILQQDGILCEQVAKEFQSGTRVHRGKVRWNSPYGFQYDRGRAVKHPQEFETLLLILKWHKSEMNSRAIADRLNEKKLRPRTASKWDRCTVHRIIEWQIKHPTFLQEVISWVSKN